MIEIIKFWRKYGYWEIPIEQVEEIINSQYEFIKSKIIELDIQDENVKTNFIIKYLGKLYVDLDKTRNKLKRENERRKTT